MPSVERGVPEALDAELAVLGGMLIDEEAVTRVVHNLHPSDFYREKHQCLARAMYALHGRGEVIDPVTLVSHLEAIGELHNVGGQEYVVQLLDAVPTAANIEYHAAHVRDRARRRRLIDAMQTTIREAYGADETEQLLDRAERRVLEIAREHAAAPLRAVGDDLWPTFEDLERRMQSGTGVTGLATGFDDLDRKTGGLQPADLILLAGRPSMGKTAMATQIMREASGRAGPVAFFSLDMSRRIMSFRLLALEASVDLAKLLRGRLSPEEQARLSTVAKRIQDLGVWIDDTGGQTAVQIRAKARRMYADHPDLSLIVVDHVQKIRGDGQENRQQEVTSISSHMKEMGKELDVPVLALSQLSRKVEERGDKRPVLADLRESGALEQDADVVLFLYRPEYYLSPADAAANKVRGKAECIIAKQRNGPTDSVELYFRKETASFEDLERRRQNTEDPR